MSVSCGEEAAATVHFLDGSEIVRRGDRRGLAPYMTQQATR